MAASNINTKVMTEDDIRQYFIQNGGIVRNTDIVTHFRTYLSHPVIRDEARVLFKTYVNKLASVKVENGEKFLVLKRQYFLPIDGNGNSNIGLPKQPSLSSYSSSTSISSAPYGHGQGYHGQQVGTGPPNFSSPPNPYGNNPGSGAAYGYPPPVVTNNNNHLRRQNSQPQLYGSQFSLSSNYADPYTNNPPINYGGGGPQNPPTGANFYPASHYSQSNPALYPTSPSRTTQPYPQHPMSQQQQQYTKQQQDQALNNYHPSNTQPHPTPEYPPEYGLPPVPVGGNMIASPPRRFPSPQNPYGSNSNINNPSMRAPPPYRPPPTLARFATSPTGPPPLFSSPPNPHGLSRRSSVSSTMSVPYHRTNSVPGQGPASYYSTSSTQNVNISQIPSSPPGMFQYQRSVSVTGLPAAVNNSTTPPGDHIRYFETLTSSPGAPAPPVPPRTKRSVERSPSAANSLSSSTSSNLNSNLGLRSRFGTKMDVESGNTDINPNQPQIQVQRNAASGQTIKEQMRIESDTDGMMDSEQEKENINHDQQNRENNHEDGDGKADDVQNGNYEAEQKISVKERMQKFNRIASESELAAGGNNKMPSSRNRREIAAKHESGDFDTASLSSLDPKAKEWMMNCLTCDYMVLHKMGQENPALIKRKDMNTALHWAAKHGNTECVKLLAGTFKADVNGKSNGGYTPLHLAAQFGRQEVYDILLKTYNADANMRDHSGKKPMQYLVRQDASMSMDTFKKLKEKRRNTEQQRDRDSSFLRIGSLNVKVKSTREAFGYFLGKSTSSASIDRMHKNWGSADNLPEAEGQEKDKQMMPPPTGGPRNGSKSSKRRTRRAVDSQTIIKESRSDSDSDTAFGFGSEWVSPVRD